MPFEECGFLSEIPETVILEPASAGVMIVMPVGSWPASSPSG